MRALYPGAAAALTAGLLLGAAMKPDLAADDRPAEPQMFTDTYLDPAAGPADDTPAYAGYPAEVPDYVLGTDWKKRARSAAETAPPPSSDLAELEKLRLSDVPSTGYRRDAALDAAPAPDDVDDAEPPPEATGDTRPAAG